MEQSFLREFSACFEIYFAVLRYSPFMVVYYDGASCIIAACILLQTIQKLASIPFKLEKNTSIAIILITLQALILHNNIPT